LTPAEGAKGRQPAKSRNRAMEAKAFFIIIVKEITGLSYQGVRGVWWKIRGRRLLDTTP
jgi:hypothetical protein